METDQIVLGGDFNLALDLTLDRQGGAKDLHEKSREVLKKYLCQKNIVDVWREHNPDKFHFTWKTSSQTHLC